MPESPPTGGLLRFLLSVVLATPSYDFRRDLLSLVSRVPVEKAILFGSYAAGQATPDSDIDIAVISPDFGKDYVEEAVMLKRISEDIDLDISPRPYSLDEYRKASRGQFLYDEILRRGRP
ncbi:MAG: nucleotidyltransferase domain-containing protein, partial [Firmicutes bacterium]|nr:nucleotidyltransferase domain-containing protein [Bacillota bacterium]